MTDGTTIIRAVPRARRGGGLSAGGFVLAMPPLRSLVEPAWQEARLAAQARPWLLVGLTVAGAALWPLTLGGLALVAPLPATLSGRMPSRDEVTAWYVLAGLLAGALTGASQWLVLRRAAGGAWSWAPLTALGWSLALFVALRGTTEVTARLRSALDTARFSLFWAPAWERYAVLAIVGAAMGLALGVAQWVALRGLRAPLGRRSVWIAACALSWSAGLAFVPVLPRTPDFVQRMGRYSGGFDYTLPALILAGALYGVLTGFALLLLLRRATPQPLET